MHDYRRALQSHQHGLAILIKLFGEEHAKTGESYRCLEITKNAESQKDKKKKGKRRTCRPF